MSTVALTTAQQQTARNAAVQAATLGYQHEPEVHYTQGSQRWQGIAEHLVASEGHFPNYADCSSFVTWAIWNGLLLLFGSEDVVNASSWQAGYTGTMLANGTTLGRASDMLPGDAVIYGTPGSTGEHTAIVVTAGTVPTVISHGSESGPYRIAYNYRSDIQSLRRYIDGRPHQATVAPTTPGGPTKPEGQNMIASEVANNGTLQLFVVGKNRDTVWNDYQPKNEGWHGGKPGAYPSSLKHFADAPGNKKIRGVTAKRGDSGALHVFVTYDDGSTGHTMQKKGETSWSPAGTFEPFDPVP
jgi:hypothetical protein